MQKLQRGLFFHRLYNKKEHFPFTGQIELTYRCNLNCVHCYYKSSEVRSQRPEVRSRMSYVVRGNRETRELTTEEWKAILDEISQEGCVNLCLTGGDPLVRHDFLELYSYAKAKGFLVTLFTNGQALTPKLIDYLVTFPPFSIEITLNGITQKTYESITQVKGSFSKVMQAISLLKQKKLPFVLKANCLKQNKQEIHKIKAFTEKLFADLPRNKFRFRYDPMLNLRYSQDKRLGNCRLSFKEIEEVRRQDPEWKEAKKRPKCRLPRLRRNKDFLYHCTDYKQIFFIDAYGYLKFCDLFDKLHKFSVNLKTTSFKEGFYRIIPRLLKEKFKTDSKCRDCKLRPICYNCPGRAYSETGSEEAPVSYFCQLAKAAYRQMKKSRKSYVISGKRAT